MDNIIGIYDDDVKQLLDGVVKMDIHRASHVEPVGDKWWIDFKPLCQLSEFRDLNIMIYGPFDTRKEALEKEEEIVKNLIKAYC